MKATFAALVPLALLLSDLPAAAGEIAAEGVAIFTNTTNRRSDLANDRTMLTIVQKGILDDRDAKSPLHLSQQDCSGTVYSVQKNPPYGAGSCVTVDRDGDAWWLSWTSDGEKGGSWTAIDGIGKYKGVAGGGTTRYLLNLKDRTAVEYSGRLTLK